MPAFPQVTRLHLKTILFPTDFSPESTSALPFARTLALIYGSTILLAHCVPPEPHLQVVMDRVPEQDDLVWQDARQKIANVEHEAAFGDIRYKSLVERGDLSEVIPAVIHERNIDLIVVGTRGRRGISKLILGSAAEKIYRVATCPVLTVGPKARSKAWALRRILCPVDPSEDPEPVLHYALSLAEENQAEFIVLQAVPLVPWQHRESVADRSRRALASLIPLEAKEWCMPQFAIRWEHPAEAIVREAEEREADLIVMSVHKSRAATWSSHLPWPVASEVVGRANCPVLTIRV